MRQIIRILLLSACLAILAVLFPKCVKYPEKDWVKIVTDMKDTKESWYLEYDYKGRLAQYGETPIDYLDDQIVVGEMGWISQKEKLIEATYDLSDGKIVRCVSRNLINIDSVWVEVKKHIHYRWEKDTLFMDSQFYSAKDNRLLRTVAARYVYDSQHRLTDVMSRYIHSEGDESACHSYFYYNNNLNYESNLNMQAFYADCEGLDTYFFFLLNESPTHATRALPNYIRHCVNHGKATYVAEALYRMEGEQPVRMEIISEEIKLKARFEFVYYDE